MDAILNIAQTLARMQWSDYLDIVVVAFLIYKLLPLIRTPSTMRIARAVLAVVVIAWLTNEMHLYTVSFILNQFLTVGLLAFVILFQPGVLAHGHRDLSLRRAAKKQTLGAAGSLPSVHRKFHGIPPFVSPMITNPSLRVNLFRRKPRNNPCNLR